MFFFVNLLKKDLSQINRMKMAVFIGERCEHIMLMHVVDDQHCDYIMVTSYRPVAILGRSVVQGWWHSGVLGSCLSTPLPIQMELCV